MVSIIRFVGPNRALELFGVKLVGFNAENGRKLLFTLVLKAVVRITEGGAWGGGTWSYIRLPSSPPLSWDLYGARNMGGMRYLWFRVPLALPTLAFALLAFWLCRRCRRTTGPGFELETVNAAVVPAERWES